MPNASGGIPPGGYKVYRRRWAMLILFVVYSMSNAFQWIQYSIIANIINRYYDVEMYIINWCSMIYMITYIPLIFPASWYLQKYVSNFSIFFVLFSYNSRKTKVVDIGGLRA